MGNKGDLVFESIGLGLYVMAANRYGDLDTTVYTQETFNFLKRLDYKIEIRESIQLLS